MNSCSSFKNRHKCYCLTEAFLASPISTSRLGQRHLLSSLVVPYFSSKALIQLQLNNYLWNYLLNVSLSILDLKPYEEKSHSHLAHSYIPESRRASQTQAINRMLLSRWVDGWKQIGNSSSFWGALAADWLGQLDTLGPPVNLEGYPGAWSEIDRLLSNERRWKESCRGIWEVCCMASTWPRVSLLSLHSFLRCRESSQIHSSLIRVLTRKLESLWDFWLPDIFLFRWAA